MKWRTVQCWRSRSYDALVVYGRHSREFREAFRRPGTCLLPAGHAGPHVWTDDAPDDARARVKRGEVPRG